MSEDALNWNSFWDLASPAEAARVLTEFYGPAAAEAAAHCAAAAQDDGRESDHRFWMAALAELTGTAPERGSAVDAMQRDAPVDLEPCARQAADKR
jgi:hypothetical protein